LNIAAQRALNAYSSVGVETGVVNATPHRLILMLFEGARIAIANAKGHMQRREVGPKCEAISKAIAIVDQGLNASLDVTAGGDLALRLRALYEYMAHRLIQANAENSEAALDEVANLLAELHGAWAAIAHTPEASGPRPAPTAPAGSRP
jgi:flagellar secretion chaperone FliS